VLIRVEGVEREGVKVFYQKNLDVAQVGREWGYVDLIVSEEEMRWLVSKGYKVKILKKEEEVKIDPEYHTYEEMKVFLDSIETQYPSIAKVYDIGDGWLKQQGYEGGRDIWAIKISDNPQEEEDEPSVLYNGVHHAREPATCEMCLYLIHYLVSRYETSEKVKNWIDSTEIWVVPIVNPEGHYVVTRDSAPDVWYRKNARDNNNNLIFWENPDDGVDLNRNYDFYWTGGDSIDTTQVYRGPAPFSEPECQAIRDLTYKQKFVLSIAYHSYGEVVMYPCGGWNPPDESTLENIGYEIANRILRRDGGGTYGVWALSYNLGQSSNWMYANQGVFEMLVEMGTEFIPSGVSLDTLCKRNLKGALYILDRLNGPCIKGHIKDSLTLTPLEAQVEVVEIFDSLKLEPRKSDPKFGRYQWLLEPGNYTLRVSCPGYKRKTINNIEVEGNAKVVEVKLQRIIGDVGVVAITNPKDSVYVDSTYYPEVWVKNYSQDTVDFKVVCKIDTFGVSIYEDTVITPKILPTQSVSLHFDEWKVVSHSKIPYQISVTTLLPGDTFFLNDTLVDTLFPIVIQRVEDILLPPPLSLSFSSIPLTSFIVFHYSLPSSGWASLKIYNLSGRVVGRVFEGKKESGSYTITYPLHFPRGIYFVKLETLTHLVVKKLVLLH
jgi:hypothetical protein